VTGMRLLVGRQRQTCWLRVLGSILAALVLVAHVGTAAQRQSNVADYDIDLLAMPSARDAGRSATTTVSPRTIMPHRGSDPAPLEVSVLTTDQLTYRVGQSVVYELLVTNRSSRPIPVPRSSVPPDSGSRAEDIRYGLIGLVYTDPEHGPQVVGAGALYGLRSDPGTLIQLAPGQSIRIRAEGPWLVQGRPAPVPPDSETEVVLRGWIDLNDAELRLFSFYSENRLSVRLRG
jgi:hypothetical protein